MVYQLGPVRGTDCVVVADGRRLHVSVEHGHLWCIRDCPGIDNHHQEIPGDALQGAVREFLGRPKAAQQFTALKLSGLALTETGEG